MYENILVFLLSNQFFIIHFYFNFLERYIKFNLYYNLIIYLKQFNIKLRIKIFYYLTKAKMVNIKYI